jgi:hypothetical protein
MQFGVTTAGAFEGHGIGNERHADEVLGLGGRILCNVIQVAMRSRSLGHYASHFNLYADITGL